jgi:hypothetical protein
MLTFDELRTSGEWLRQQQHESGLVPWFTGGHADPWNHVEAAMALTVAGFVAEAKLAYRWLAVHQLGDGSWFHYYLDGGVESARLDSNVCAYIATGLLHYVLATGDSEFAQELWPVIEKALDFVLACQREDGSVAWSRLPNGSLASGSLIAGSSSLSHSLQSAARLAEMLGHDGQPYTHARERLIASFTHSPHHYLDKQRFAMDWYYPVLAGVTSAETAIATLQSKEALFVSPEKGVRCVSDHEWCTTAETAEASMAYLRSGLRSEARALLSTTRRHRHDDGSYWTGTAEPNGATFPPDECSTYSVAAVMLASDAIDKFTPASELFLS